MPDGSMDTQLSFIEASDQQVVEVNGPDPVFHLFQADLFPTQYVTEEEEPPLSKPDRAARFHLAQLEVTGITGLRQSRGQRAWRGSESRGRRGVRQRFVGALLVELRAEGIEAFLLPDQVPLGRTRCLRFKRTVHPFVAAVLLRLPGGDPLVLDSELDPRHAQPREPAQRRRSERRTVIRADRHGQAMLREQLGEDRGRSDLGRRGQRVARHQVSRVRIRNGERVAQLPISQAEFAFKVRGPNLVRGRRHQGSAARMDRLPPPAPRVDQPVALQDRSGGALGGQEQLRLSLLQIRHQLLGAPVRMLLSLSNQRRFYVHAGLVRTGMRGPAAVLQPGNSFLAIAVQPLVADASRDVETLAEVRHRIQTFVVQSHEKGSFGHGCSFFPRHEVSSRLEVESVTHVPGPVCYLCNRFVHPLSLPWGGSLILRTEGNQAAASPTTGPVLPSPPLG